MSSITFPTTSINTPHGHQFGRDQYEFLEEAPYNPEFWNTTESETSYEQTPEARAESIREANESARQAAQSSRIEAQAIAQPIERGFSREYEVQSVHNLAQLGGNMRFMRDHKNDFALVA